MREGDRKLYHVGLIGIYLTSSVSEDTTSAKSEVGMEETC